MRKHRTIKNVIRDLCAGWPWEKSIHTAYFTICSSDHIARARVLAQSLKLADRSAKLWVIVLNSSHEHAEAHAAGLNIIPVTQLEIPQIAEMAARYSNLELSCAIKPFGFDFVFDRLGYNRAIYLDTDIYVLKPFSDVQNAFDFGAACILTPHLTQPLGPRVEHPNDVVIILAGIYNMGFAAFANVPEARRFLKWWGEQLARDCVIAPERGVFLDQKYCDFAPCFIEECKILQHPGYNVAYWNLIHRQITLVDDEFRVGKFPVHFVHFSGIDIENPDLFSRCQTYFRRGSLNGLDPIYESYLSQLIDAEGRMAKTNSSKFS